MKFTALKCHQPVAVQKLIRANLDAWKYLPERDRTKIRQLVGEIAKTPMEGRALYDVLIRGKSPEVTATVTFVAERRIYQMRRDFYDMWEI